jgi:hypothetical protein
VTVSFALLYAIVTYQSIKTKVYKEPGTLVNALTGMLSAGLGVLLAHILLSNALGQTMSSESAWFSIVIGAFISLMFLFYYSY